MSRYERILVAVDQGEDAEAPLRLGLELATRMGAELIVFHAIDEDEQKDRESLPAPSSHVDVMVQETLTDLSALAAAVGDGDMAAAVGDGDNQPQVRVVARSGEPAEEIQKLVAGEDCDLVVIGLRRRSRVGKFLFGSNLQDILMTTQLPVITVPIAAAPEPAAGEEAGK
jgi:nucleotide-binding universal stress UspA family protein